jgi:uncharacterized protein (TIGR00255 family)
MTSSMTAFARQQTQMDQGTLLWEIRSVNHRYLEPAFKLPEPFRGLEAKLRSLLRQAVHRGKVDCTLQFLPAEAPDQSLEVNDTAIQQLVAACRQIHTAYPESRPPSSLDILQWPGILRQPEADLTGLHQAALEGYQCALDDLVAHRKREGAALQDALHARLQRVVAETRAVVNRLPLVLQLQREKLQSRIGELTGLELEPQRLEQEVALLTQKADVDEELDRLSAHLTETRRVLGSEGAIGRRLDFLMQEFNREANTLAAKSIDSETTQCAINLKVLTEQMREQVQNIE